MECNLRQNESGEYQQQDQSQRCNTDCGVFPSHAQMGLGRPLFETTPDLDMDVDCSLSDPAWLDEYWFRRLALPSVEPERDQ